MLTIETSKLVNQLKQLQEEIERKLQNMVQDWATDTVYHIALGTPLGDSIKNEEWYDLREMVTGLAPIEGISRGAWQVSLNGSIEFVPTYGQSTANIAQDNTYSSMDRFPLGKSFTIGASTPYLYKLDKGTSPQLQGGFEPMIKDVIFGAFKVNLKDKYDGV